MWSVFYWLVIAGIVGASVAFLLYAVLAVAQYIILRAEEKAHAFGDFPAHMRGRPHERF